MIKGFIFEKFKGYDNTVLWLEQITTLVGTNASGKSNAVEGIQILSELAVGRELNLIFEGSNNIESAIRGGAKGCCRFNSKSFTLGCIVNWNETHDLLYRIEIGVGARVTINTETMYMVKNGNTDAKAGSVIFKATASDDGGDISVEYTNGKRGTNPQLKAIRSMSVLSQLQESLSNIFVIDPIPFNMHGYSRIGDSQLRRNCANVSAVLYALKKNKTTEWEAFNEIVRQLPENEIKDISFITTAVNDVILVQKEENGSSSANMDASRLSVNQRVV